MKLITTLLILIPILSFSQNSAEKQLDAIATLKDAKAYIENNKTSQSEIISYSAENEKTELTDALFALAVGEKMTVKTDSVVAHYKILSKEKAPQYRVSIIEFDSNKTTLSEINSLRSFILKGIKNGEHKFPNLARVYSNHPSGKTGGDLGWIKEGTRSKRFEKSVRDNRTGRVYTFDDYRDRLHYVIMKNFDNQISENVTVLKLTETN